MNFTFKLLLIASAVLIFQSEVFGKALSGIKDIKGPPGREHHHGIPPLPFLKGLNKTDVKEFLSIRRNSDLTKAQVKEREDAWASKQSVAVKTAYDEFKVNRTKFGQKLKANITKTAANLTAEAKVVFDQIKKVKENQNISYKEERKQIKSILNGTTPEIRSELKKTMPRPSRGPGGHRGKKSQEGRRGPNKSGEKKKRPMKQSTEVPKSSE